MYIEYIELCIFYEKLYTLNKQNCVPSIYNIVYILWKFVYAEYTKLYTFFEKIVYIEHTELYTFLKKWNLNVQSCIHSLKKFVPSIYKIVYTL